MIKYHLNINKDGCWIMNNVEISIVEIEKSTYKAHLLNQMRIMNLILFLILQKNRNFRI